MGKRGLRLVEFSTQGGGAAGSPLEPSATDFGREYVPEVGLGLEGVCRGVSQNPISVLQVSRPGNFHPQALAEPYVNVSAHTAPIIQLLGARPFLSVGEPPGLTTSNPTQPMFSSALISSEPLVLPHGPFHQATIELAQDRRTLDPHRFSVAPVAFRRRVRKLLGGDGGHLLTVSETYAANLLTKVDIWARKSAPRGNPERPKTPAFLDAGGGTRTPDTRIMIPLL